ncbi:hypothetical protein QTP70_032779 [Hemibagrus guttatus]|uniref:Uncharacterized protein n=1 Tax=Hemibagrus guttatus TaxID=175788 RepID=A0AAE0RDE6_9TELE|nr:hypothetical protein QTP70_032779 [Hemibagrus guttatus]
MASLAQRVASPLSLRNGVRCVTANGVTVEEVLLGIGKEMGYDSISSASRMNKAVVVFVKKESHVRHLTNVGIVVSGEFVLVSPLIAPTVCVTVSNVPPFIPNGEIERGLTRYGTLASAIRTVPLGCKNGALKHMRHWWLSGRGTRRKLYKGARRKLCKEEDGQEIEEKDGQEIEEEDGQEIEEEDGQEIEKEDVQEIEKEDGQEIEKEDGQEIEEEDGQEIEKEDGQEIEKEDGQEIEEEDGQEIEKEDGQEIEKEDVQEIEKEDGQEIEEEDGQEIEEEDGQEIEEEDGQNFVQM